MLVVWILIGFVLVIVLWLLFVPVTVVVNTDLEKYEIAQWGIVRVSFHPNATRKVSISVLGFAVNSKGNEGQEQAERDAKGKRKKGSSWRSRKSTSAWWYLVRGIYKAMRMRRLIFKVDLDDVVWAARLTPVLLFINRGPVEVSTNMNNLYFLDLEANVRVYRVLWTVFIFFIRY